jgi:hypothetical protein
MTDEPINAHDGRECRHSAKAAPGACAKRVSHAY